jgi:galactitol-specific phosphotransferase system IIC component
MTKSVCAFAGNPSAIFQAIMDVTVPLSIGPTEMTFLVLFVIAIFFGVVYSKRLRIFIDYLVGDRIE